MRRIFIFTISLIILATGIIYAKNNGWFASPTAFAVGDLTVNWGVPEGQPIFIISNAAPGDSVTRTVSIQNGATSARPIGIRGNITQQNPPTYSTKLFIKISQNGTEVYGANNSKTLKNFIDEGGLSGISLGTLNSGQSKNYNIMVTFDPTADNAFQNATITFDMFIGISIDIPTACNAMQFNGPTIFGTEGNDTIRGTSKNELIVALEGNDTIDAGSGNDCVIGGEGKNIINGGSGNEVISSLSGNDKIDGGSGNDKVTSGTGDDTLIGGSGNDVLNAETGTDTADGGSGTDTCIASGTKKSCEKTSL